MRIDEAARVFTDPVAYADEKRFHAACALLRRDAPITRVDVDGFSPFWAVTKHDDVTTVERDPDLWRNPLAPDHPVYRHISSGWFKPRSIARLGERTTELAKRYVDRMAALGGVCDFVTNIAVHYPLYVIRSLIA